MPNEIFEEHNNVILASSLIKMAETNVQYIYVLNITEHQVTIIEGKVIDKFSTLTSDQAENLEAVDPQLINVAKMSGNYFTEVNQLFQVRDTTNRKTQPSILAPNFEKILFPTPETCPDATNLSPLQREIFEQLLKLHEMEKLGTKGYHQDKFMFSRKLP